MRCLILAAGLGTRLRPITNRIPKCMVKIGGKPVLEHLIDYLNSYGITEIIVNLHWKPRAVYKYFGTRLLYFYEPELLGEKETEKRLRNWLLGGGNKYLVMNGDTLTDLNIDKLRDQSFLWGSVLSWDDKEHKYTGIKIVDSDKRGRPKHEDFKCYWQDMGVFEGLAKARWDYEKKTNNLSRLRTKRNNQHFG